jgi:acetyl esterase/lipase
MLHGKRILMGYPLLLLVWTAQPGCTSDSGTHPADTTHYTDENLELSVDDWDTEEGVDPAFDITDEEERNDDADTDQPDTSVDEPDPTCIQNGCLREYFHVGDYSKQTVQLYLSPGVTIYNGYSVYTFIYMSDGREVLGTATIPFDVHPPAGGYHIVVNAHGTTGVADECAMTGTVAGTGLAGTFGARGFIGVTPDYPGLGTPGPHPYLVRIVEGRAVLDSLRATRHLTGLLKVPISERLAVAGLSQGGHAVLGAAAEHASYAPDLDIRSFAAAAPAIVWWEHWSQAITYDGPHMMYLALSAWAWSKHYGYDGPTIWADTLADDIDTYMETCCANSETPGDSLSQVISTTHADVFSKDFFDAYVSGEWGDFKVFEQAFFENRVGPYEQTAPLIIYQGDADDVVPEWQTNQAVNALREGGVDVEYEVVPDGTHIDVAFGFLAYQQLRTDLSIAWIREHLDADQD